MRAATFTTAGGPLSTVKVVEDVPKPVPTAKQVLIKVGAASYNPLDGKVRMNKMPGFAVRGNGAVWPPKQGAHPFIPGYDVAGVVESAPPGSPFTKGQRVVGFTTGFGFGTFAQYVALSTSEVAPLPDNVSMVDGAAVSLVGVTALQMLKKVGPAKPGATVLINGAAGGVGSVLVQLAKAKGFNVVATASAKNADKVKALGASEVIDYAVQPDYEAYAAKAGGYQGIIDLVGTSGVAPKGNSLKPGGLYVRLVTDMTLQLVLGFALTALTSRVGWGPRYTLGFTAANGADVAEVMDAVSKGTVKPQVDKVFTGLDEVVAAMQYAEEGRPQGKVVLVVDPSLK